MRQGLKLVLLLIITPRVSLRNSNTPDMLTSARLLGFGFVTGFMIANSVAVEVRGGRILSVEASGRVQDAENMIRKVPKQSLATLRSSMAPAAALTFLFTFSNLIDR